jgi:hypothetical protein
MIHRPHPSRAGSSIATSASLGPSAMSATRRHLLLANLLSAGLFILLLYQQHALVQYRSSFPADPQAAFNSGARGTRSSPGAAAASSSSASPMDAAGHAATAPVVAEAFVLALHKREYDEFVLRNVRSDITRPVWVPGVNGFDQQILDLWADMSGQYPPLNAMHFTKGLQEQKDMYASPHAVGCYLAHWHLLRILNDRPAPFRPEFYFILEDDSRCFPRVIDRIARVSRQLPSDWDILYVTGKPVTTFQAESYNESWTDDEFRTAFCQDDRFGSGDSPTTPDGGRELSTSMAEQPYWRVYEMFNTNGYAVNPKRLDRIVQVLKLDSHTPIDVKFADAMRQGGELNAYMSTEQLCEMDENLPSFHPHPQPRTPLPWRGYYRFAQPHAQGNFWYRWLHDIRVSQVCNVSATPGASN